MFRGGKWNGYLMLVANLAASQLFYDLSTFLLPLRGHLSITMYVGFRSAFGTVSSLWTNAICAIVFYIIWNLQSFECSKYIRYILIGIYSLPFVLGVLLAREESRNGSDLYVHIYFYCRVASITFNLLLLIIATIKLKFSKEHREKLREAFAPLSLLSEDPLSILINRFKYYPMIQCISRGVVSLYELRNGYNYRYRPNDSLKEKIELFCYVIILPSLGTLYFLVYLAVSPRGMKILHRVFKSVTHRRPSQGEDSSQGDSDTLYNSQALSLFHPLLHERNSSLWWDPTRDRITSTARERVTSGGRETLPASVLDEDELIKEIDKIYGSPIPKILENS
jgi:hypothetical protein